MADEINFIKNLHPIDQCAYSIGLLPNGINHLSQKAKIHLRMGFLIIVSSVIYCFFIWNILFNLILNHGFFNTSNLKNMIFGFIFSIFLSFSGLIFDVMIFTQYIPQINSHRNLDLLNKIYMYFPPFHILKELTRPIYLIKIISIFIFAYCSNLVIRVAFFDVPIEKRARYEQTILQASITFEKLNNHDTQIRNRLEMIYKRFIMSILTNHDLKMDSIFKMSDKELKKILNSSKLTTEEQIKIQDALKSDLFEFHFKSIDIFEKNRILKDLVKGSPPQWPNTLDATQVQYLEDKMDIKKFPSKIEQKILEDEGSFFYIQYLIMSLFAFFMPMMTLSYKMTLNEEELNNYYANQSQSNHQSQNDQGAHKK